MNAAHAGEAEAMSRWALLFLLLALVAGAIGLVGVEWMPSLAAWGVCVLFSVLFVVMWHRGPPM